MITIVIHDLFSHQPYAAIPSRLDSTSCGCRRWTRCCCWSPSQTQGRPLPCYWHRSRKSALLRTYNSWMITHEYKAFLRGHPCHHLQATLLSTWRHLADTQRSAACWYKLERLLIRCWASLCICFCIVVFKTSRTGTYCLWICVFVYDTPLWLPGDWGRSSRGTDPLCSRQRFIFVLCLFFVFSCILFVFVFWRFCICILFVSFCICLRDAQIHCAAAVKAFQSLSIK